jgi:hypothetical protein
VLMIEHGPEIKSITCWNRASISCRFLVFACKRRPT